MIFNFCLLKYSKINKEYKLLLILKNNFILKNFIMKKILNLTSSKKRKLFYKI